MGAGATRLRGQPVEDPQPLDEARDDEGVREEAVEHDGHRHLVPLAPEPHPTTSLVTLVGQTIPTRCPVGGAQLTDKRIQPLTTEQTPQ